MLSIGIKNAILVILIILIIHFLMKNVILERSAKKPSEPFTNTKKDPADPLFPPVMKKPEVCKQVRFGDVQKKRTEEEAMRRYVDMGDDDTNLDKFFKDNIVSTEVKELEKSLSDGNNVCKFKADNQQLPVSSTCDANVQVLSDPKKVVKADCDLPQEKKNIMILKEYEDENDMNGGACSDGPSAFDTFDLDYVPYECSST